MGTRPAEVGEDVLVHATPFFHGIRKNREPDWVKRPGRQLSVLVSGLGQGKHGWSEAGRGKSDRAERIADDVTQESRRSLVSRMGDSPRRAEGVEVFGGSGPSGLYLRVPLRCLDSCHKTRVEKRSKRVHSIATPSTAE
jgi:hypothetical protein